MQVISQQGDTLDLMCYRFYGHTQNVETVLEANPKLAFLPATLPIGTVVIMPDAVPSQTSASTIQLWD
jgi:phage tail protein X